MSDAAGTQAGCATSWEPGHPSYRFKGAPKPHSAGMLAPAAEDLAGKLCLHPSYAAPRLSTSFQSPEEAVDVPLDPYPAHTGTHEP